MTSRSTKLSSGLLALAFPVFFAACGANGGPRDSGRRAILFVDQSASVSHEQRRLWAREAQFIVQRLTAGWAIAIYPLHDRTLEAAPLFEAEIPELPPDPSLDGTRKYRAALKLARTGALTALHQAFEAGGRAMRTDVFSAIDRIAPDPKGRPTMLVVFSDMLNSTADLNMEAHGRLTRANAAARIEHIAGIHHWGPGQLRGVDVYCLLNSIDTGQPGPAVDRLTQREFYDMLFRAMGARLAVYDTTLGLGQLAGGSHAAE